MVKYKQHLNSASAQKPKDNLKSGRSTHLTNSRQSLLFEGNPLFSNNCKGLINIKIKGIDIGETLHSLKTKDGRRDFYKNHKHIVLYFTFGIGTTIISLGSYYLFRILFPNAESAPPWLQWIFKITAALHIESSTVLPVLLSWILANLFSFFTNRVLVFESQARNFFRVMLELGKFFASRIATLIVDTIIMFLLVDLQNIHGGLYEFCAKIFSNIIVLILNYILSKIFVFRKKKAKIKPANAEKQE